MNAPAARDPITGFNVSGSGIKIGIISDSFNALGGQAAGVTSGDLPAGVTILKDDFHLNSIDEGRAMAEIVHDVAPGAQILFHSAFNNTYSGTGLEPSGYSIATAINNLVAAGANVIVDDVALRTQPAYQLDAASMAIRNARNNGVAYFTAAGNAGTEAYEGIYTPIGGTGGNSKSHDFKSGVGQDNVLDLGTIAPGSSAVVQLHWQDPYKSLNSASTVQSNFDLYLINLTTGTLLLPSQGASYLFDLDDPVELAAYTNSTGVAQSIGIYVDQTSGITNQRLKVTVQGTITDDDDTNSPTIFGHQLSPDGVSVAAHRFDNLTSVEGFSSRGPGTLLFDEDGNPIFEILDVPRLTGPNGGNTTFFGSDYAGDPDAFPNFFGTSAAAPHVAAVAALMMERANDLGISLSVSQLYQLLFDTAVDMHAPGYDYLSGYGRVDAYAAVAAVPEPTLFTAASFVGLMFVRRRRR